MTRNKGKTDRPISLAPLKTTEAVKGLLETKPIKGKAVAAKSKKAGAKKRGKASAELVKFETS